MSKLPPATEVALEEMTAARYQEENVWLLAARVVPVEEMDHTGVTLYDWVIQRDRIW